MSHFGTALRSEPMTPAAFASPSLLLVKDSHNHALH